MSAVCKHKDRHSGSGIIHCRFVTPSNQLRSCPALLKAALPKCPDLISKVHNSTQKGKESKLRDETQGTNLMSVCKCRRGTQSKRRKKHCIPNILEVQGCTTTGTHHHTGTPIYYIVIKHTPAMLTHNLCSNKTHTVHSTTKSFILQSMQPSAFAAHTLDSPNLLFTPRLIRLELHDHLNATCDPLDRTTQPGLTGSIAQPEHDI